MGLCRGDGRLCVGGGGGYCDFNGEGRSGAAEKDITSFATTSRAGGKRRKLKEGVCLIV